MGIEASKDDIRELRAEFREMRQENREGVSGVHARLDKINGRVGYLEVSGGRADERISALEDWREQRVSAATQPLQVSDSTKQMGIGAGIGAGLVGAGWALAKLIGWLT